MHAIQAAVPAPSALAARLRREIVGLDHVLLTGSCSRRTALSSNHDVDLLLALDERTHFSARRRGPGPCLDTLSAAVQRAFPTSAPPRIQNRSVRLRLTTTGQCFDLVPAFRHPRWPCVYLIPDRKRDQWILTCPEHHRHINQDIDRRTGHLFNPIVRAVKSWNYAHGKPLSSFHLEALAYRALAAPPRDLYHGLSLVLGSLANAVMETCPDPAAIGPAIDEGLDEARRQLARGALLAAIDRAHDVRSDWPGGRRTSQLGSMQLP